VPCKGLNKLSDLLHKIEDYFHCKVWQNTISSEVSPKIAVTGVNSCLFFKGGIVLGFELRAMNTC
jgi:hypothetical protein